ncbi:MAG: hypothetical protein RR501_05295 [Cloacibacillus sp.]
MDLVTWFISRIEKAAEAEKVTAGCVARKKGSFRVVHFCKV